MRKINDMELIHGGDLKKKIGVGCAIVGVLSYYNIAAVLPNAFCMGFGLGEFVW